MTAATVSPPEPRVPVTTEAAIDELAARLTAELAGLRRALEPVRDTWPAGPLLPAAPEECDIAADGLFGPTGVIDVIIRAMRAPRADPSDR
jgi:hypothetical protein